MNVSEDAFGYFEALLLHTGQGGAGHVLGAPCLGEPPLLQYKVIVGRRIHGVEHIGIVWNLQFCRGHRKMYYLITER